jgi:hypothetical protein
MQKANEFVRSEQIRMKLGILTPAEREAEAKAKVKPRSKAKEHAGEKSLFDDEDK